MAYSENGSAPSFQGLIDLMVAARSGRKLLSLQAPTRPPIGFWRSHRETVFPFVAVPGSALALCGQKSGAIECLLQGSSGHKSRNRDRARRSARPYQRTQDGSFLAAGHGLGCPDDVRRNTEGVRGSISAWGVAMPPVLIQPAPAFHRSRYLQRLSRSSAERERSLDIFRE